MWGRNRAVWPLVALAATLALTCGLWLLRDFGAVNQEQPWAPEIVFQEETSGLDFVPTPDGSPWGVETRRLREVILRPDLERAAKKRGRLEVERIERHPIKLIRWDYR